MKSAASTPSQNPPTTPPHDIIMQTPSHSPSQNLQGASRITGGVFRGRAQGNVYNFADATDVFTPQPAPSGKVLVYESTTSDDKPNPLVDKPSMSIKHAVTDSLILVLRKLGLQYSPV